MKTFENVKITVILDIFMNNDEIPIKVSAELSELEYRILRQGPQQSMVQLAPMNRIPVQPRGASSAQIQGPTGNNGVKKYYNDQLISWATLVKLAEAHLCPQKNCPSENCAHAAIPHKAMYKWARENVYIFTNNRQQSVATIPTWKDSIRQNRKKSTNDWTPNKNLPRTTKWAPIQTLSQTRENVSQSTIVAISHPTSRISPNMIIPTSCAQDTSRAGDIVQKMPNLERIIGRENIERELARKPDKKSIGYQFIDAVPTHSMASCNDEMHYVGFGGELENDNVVDADKVPYNFETEIKPADPPKKKICFGDQFLSVTVSPGPCNPETPAATLTANDLDNELDQIPHIFGGIFDILDEPDEDKVETPEPSKRPIVREQFEHVRTVTTPEPTLNDDQWFFNGFF